MTNEQKLALLEEMLDIEEGSLNEGMELADVENWDSMAMISLIALVDENFGKTFTANEIKSFNSLKDILEKME